MSLLLQVVRLANSLWPCAGHGTCVVRRSFRSHTIHLSPIDVRKREREWVRWGSWCDALLTLHTTQHSVGPSDVQ
jgi:hypothetical protein